MYDSSLDSLANNLGPILDRVVVNRTGLVGSYAIEADYSSTVNPAQPGNAERVSIFTAIQEQLGLRLQPGVASMEVLVIDALERPTPN